MGKVDPTMVIKQFQNALRFQHYDPSLLRRCIISLPQKPLPSPFYAQLYTKLLQTDVNYNRGVKVELDRIISASTRESSIFQRLQIGSLRLRFRLEAGIECSNEALQLQEQILKKELTLSQSAGLSKLLIANTAYFPKAYLRCLRSLFLMLEEYLAKEISPLDSFSAWITYSRSNVLYSSQLRDRIYTTLMKQLDAFTLNEYNKICISMRRKNVDMLSRMEEFQNKYNRKRLLRMAINTKIGEEDQAYICGKYAKNYTEALDSLKFAKGFLLAQPYITLLPFQSSSNPRDNAKIPLLMKIDGTYEILIDYVHSYLLFQQYFIPVEKVSLILRAMRTNILNLGQDGLNKTKSSLTSFQEIEILIVLKKYNLQQKALLEDLICFTLNRAALKKISLADLFQKKNHYAFAINILKIIILGQPNPLQSSFIDRLLNDNPQAKHIKALFNFVTLMNAEQKQPISTGKTKHSLQSREPIPGEEIIQGEQQGSAQNVCSQNKLREIILTKNMDKGHFPFVIYWVKNENLKAKWANFCSDKNICEQTLERKWQIISKEFMITEEVYLQPGVMFSFAIFNKTSQTFLSFVELRADQFEPYLLETPESNGKILTTSYLWREMFIRQFFGNCDYVVAREQQELGDILCSKLNLLVQ